MSEDISINSMSNYTGSVHMTDFRLSSTQMTSKKNKTLNANIRNMRMSLMSQKSKLFAFRDIEGKTGANEVRKYYKSLTSSTKTINEEYILSEHA